MGKDNVTKLHKRSPKQTLQERVIELMERWGISITRLALEIGMSKSVVSQWLSGKYDHQSTIVPAVQAWMSRMMATGEMVLDLQNTRRVIEVCRYAITERKLVAIVGQPGLGKTVALREFHRQRLKERNEIIYYYTSPQIKPRSLASMIVRRLQISNVGSSHDVLERIKNRLCKKPIPMIFDEAQALNVPCLESLRYLWDQTKVPLILVGSATLQRTIMEPSERHPELAQLQSRIGFKLILKKMRLTETKKFIRAFFSDDELGDAANAKAVFDEFQSWSRGVPRDIDNGIQTSRAIMKHNDVTVVTPEIVRAAFEQQLMVA